MPMLASTAGSVAEALATLGGAASVEYKLDGARIQVHRDGDDVRVYTRNLADITHRVPEIVEAVRALPARAGDPRRRDAVARRGRRAAARSRTRCRASGPRASPSIALRPWFFDILHLDGRDLIDEPLATRLALLEAVAGPSRMPGIVTDEPEAAAELSREALAAGHEGVMIKARRLRRMRRAAAARAGSRSSRCSPSISSCSPSSGARAGAPASSRTCTSAPATREGAFGAPGGFVMVGKTFKGLTDELLRWQTVALPDDRDPSLGLRGARAPRDRRRDRDRRRAALVPVSRRRRAPVRPRQGISPRQVAGRGRHDLEPRRAPALSAADPVRGRMGG